MCVHESRCCRREFMSHVVVDVSVFMSHVVVDVSVFISHVVVDVSVFMSHVVVDVSAPVKEEPEHQQDHYMSDTDDSNDDDFSDAGQSRESKCHCTIVASACISYVDTQVVRFIV